MVAREPESGFRYWAFISYSHQDQAWGRWLARALETWRIPPRLVGQPIAAGTIPPRLSPVFRDRDELPTATDLNRTVAEALRQSWSLIVICSPASAQSRWVNEEVREFQRLGGGERIHCLIVDGDDATATTAAPSFPPALRERPLGQASPGEPIAADARRSGDGKAAARLKLIAGILGISYDKLVQRDHQRGYRRMAAIAAAALLALALLTTFTIVTITSRRDAEAQRSHAEGLVEFMLGDLRQKLEPEGRLATLDAVGKEALGYYAAQDPAKLDADALARRARALLLIGEVYDQRGRLDDALGVFRQAADSTAELLARDGANPQRIFDHAQSVFWVGLIAWRRGEVDAAEPAFRTYMALAERLVAIDPRNADWQAEVEYAAGNLGTLLHGEGHIDEAAAAFEQALRIARTLAQKAPNDAARQFELAQSYAWLADARLEQGRLQDAMNARETEVAIYEELLATDSRNHDARRARLVAEQRIGKLSRLQGHTALAVSQLRRAAGLAREALAADPDNTATRSEAALAWLELAKALEQTGDRTGALAENARALDAANGLVDRDASVTAWQVRLGSALLLQARLEADSDVLGALRRAQGVMQRLDTLRQANRLDAGARELQAESQLLSGDLHAALGDRARASENWRDALATLEDGTPLRGPSARAMSALALQHLGRDDEAAPIRTELDRIGYHYPGLEKGKAVVPAAATRLTAAGDDG